MDPATKQSTLMKSTGSLIDHTGATSKLENVGDRYLEAEKLDIIRVFKVIDSDGSGYIDADELKKVLIDLGFDQGGHVSAACDRVFENIGVGTDKISADLFYEIMSRKLDKNSKEEEIDSNFEHFLRNSGQPRKDDAVINADCLISVARTLGETLEYDTAVAMIKEFNTEKDKNGKLTGTISLEEFRAIMKGDLVAPPQASSAPASPKNATVAVK